jgi:Zn-dependent oligopeptidase
MWFVDVLYPTGSSTTFGISLMPGNAIAIANAVFASNRIDTLAHEIGHSLGLIITRDRTRRPT